MKHWDDKTMEYHEKVLGGHTPGPWEVNGTDSEGRERVCRHHGGWNIALILPATSRDKEENKANAHLVAAAPELLEACNVALASLRATSCTCNDDRDCLRCTTLRKIKQAIAKAEGKEE